MSKLNYGEIEKKWQKYWSENGINKTSDNFEDDKKSDFANLSSHEAMTRQGVTSRHGKFYILDMFPYPSGEGLHVGHPKGYIATDVYSRMKKMQGYNVLHPMGWDAFGLPAEQFAIKNKINPNIATSKNVARYKEQIEMLGLNYDWDREINTTDPKYYKWTQWMWKQMYKDGLAYESFDPINWCPTCKTGLSNEDLDGNTCERCGTIVEKKKLRQWTIRITDYADRLLNDLDKLNWEPHIKELQRNWIGKSEGSEIEFYISPEIYGFDLKTSFDTNSEMFKTDRKRSVAIIKIKDTDRFLGFKKQNNEKIFIPGGGIEIGESIIKSAQREVEEEIGVKDIRHICSLASFRGFENYELFEIEEGYKVYPSELDQKGGTLVEFTKEEILKNDWAQVSYIFNNLERLEKINSQKSKLKIFTTRADTLFGCTFMAISYTLAKEWIENGWDANDDIKKFIIKLEQEEKERTIDFDMSKLEKEGIDTGIKAINPANGEEVPIYIANYILSDYGTGAIMAVPAHDERDYEFAKKYNLEIREIISKDILSSGVSAFKDEKQTVNYIAVSGIVETPDGKIVLLKESNNTFSFPGGGVDNGEDPLDAVKREISEETGFIDIDSIKDIHLNYFTKAFREHKDINYACFGKIFYVKLKSLNQIENESNAGKHEINLVEKNKVLDLNLWDTHRYCYELFLKNKIIEDEGILINSGDFDGMNSEEARIKITEKVGGKIVSKYKLKDWVFARQRYWGEPFPIVFDENRKSYAVADKDLPVILPNVENYEPTDNGESPLANIKDWVEVFGFINNEGEFESISGVHSERELKTINTYKENFETYISETVQEISGEWKEESDFIVEKLKGKKVLEIGSASGRDASYLKNGGVDIIASDIVDSFSKINIDKGLEFIKIDPLLDDFHNEKYDGVLSMASLLHSEKYNFEKIITKINLALNDNGYLYLRLKNGEGELEEERKGGYRFFSFFNENELKNILEKFGFEIEKITYLENNKWINVLAKKNKNLEIKKFYRETNTMPQWAGSSWYYLRYIDPKNDQKFVDKELEKEWSPVDFYVGGAEHATRHLIYARFWHKYLFDKGYVNYDEPFSKLQTVGLIMAEDGKKMSKRYGNVVNPDDIVKEYGADSMRTYEMFMGPFEKSIAWNTNSMAGVSRFLERVYNLSLKFSDKTIPSDVGPASETSSEIVLSLQDSKEVERVINETIKKVGEDIEKFGFNTAIAQLMICLNTFEDEIKKGNGVSRDTFIKFIQILSPFAVHICEEIYQNILENKNSIHLSEWPDYDEAKIKKEEIEMSIQIAGKMRGTFTIKPDSSDEEVKELVKDTEVYRKYITSEEQIKKIIIVKNRLINIVI